MQTTIYQFKITLSHVQPEVWRRVEVPGDITLYRFAAILISAMGWHGGHMHQFRIGKTYYGIPDEESDRMHDERGARLQELVEAGTKRMIFDYDFGDGWEHAVVLEATLEAQRGAVYPRCTAGARQCPPEDCGGPPGYEQFLEAAGDPQHPEHEAMLEWAGGDFDPEEFDLEEFADLGAAAESMEELWEDSAGG